MLILAETTIEAAMAEQVALEPELYQKLGASSRSLMDRQSLLLATIADKLVKNSKLPSGPGLAVYCILEIQENEKEISPFGVLRRMPVAQAFWGALTAQAQGSVRIFSWSPDAAEIACAQAALDLEDGVCENALVLCCSFSPWQVWGKAWAAH